MGSRSTTTTGSEPPVTVLGARDAIARGELDPRSLLDAALAAVRRHSDLNAIAHLPPAPELAAALRAAPAGPLHGVPITVKDLYAVEAMPTLAGTRAPLPDLGREAAAVTRLKRAGAIVLAKTNMQEIAAGIDGENPWTGDVKNPHDPDRQAGGSSSGSAVAVACRMGLASLGTDTGGSIRIPASLCGVVGFKPTYGSIPMDGALPLAWSCDHAGPLTPTVEDAHLLTEVLADRAIRLRPRDAARPIRLGVPRRFLDGWLGSAVRHAFDRLIEMIVASRVEIVEVEAPALEEAIGAYIVMRGSEAAFVHRIALERDPEGFSPLTRERLRDGARVTAGQYFEAQRVRDRMRREIEASLDDVEAWILPATPLPAPLRGTSEVELERGRTDHRTAFVRFTLPFSLVGVPALALPMGSVDGLPIGLQIVGSTGADSRVLEIGRWVEARLAVDA